MDKYEYIVMYFLRYACHEIVSIQEDEDASAVIFMKTNDGRASHEDSANENDGGLIDNFSEVNSMHQLKLCFQMDVE